MKTSQHTTVQEHLGALTASEEPLTHHALSTIRSLALLDTYSTPPGTFLVRTQDVSNTLGEDKIVEAYIALHGRGRQQYVML